MPAHAALHPIAPISNMKHACTAPLLVLLLSSPADALRVDAIGSRRLVHKLAPLSAAGCLHARRQPAVTMVAEEEPPPPPAYEPPPPPMSWSDDTSSSTSKKPDLFIPIMVGASFGGYALIVLYDIFFGNGLCGLTIQCSSSPWG